MKKLLILVTLISSLMMPSLAHAKWTKVAENVKGDTYYVDFERIKKHEGLVYYWQVTDYLKPNEHGSISSKIYIEAECDRVRWRYLNDTYYKGPMGSGTISSSSNTPDENWTFPSPNSVSAFILKTVCNHKSMQ